MATYRKLPVPVEAVQFTGDNWAEMHAFTDHRLNPATNVPEDVFNPIGTHLSDYMNDGAAAELWVEANASWLPIMVGEWVLKDALGFYPCKDEVFIKTYVLESEHKMLFVDEKIPLLDATADDSRMLGRIVMALMLHRPQSEVNTIVDRVISVFAQYRVGIEGRRLAELDEARHDAMEAVFLRVLVEEGFFFEDEEKGKNLARNLRVEMQDMLREIG